MSMDETYMLDIQKEVNILGEKMTEDHALSAEDTQRLKELADTGDRWARYQYSMFLYTIKNDIHQAIDIWKSLSDENYPLAMEKLGDYYFYENAPENWDIAYDNYTKEGSIPLSKARKTAIKDILNHGKFNKRVLIMSITFCVISIAIMLFMNSFVLFHMNVFLRIIFIILDVLIVVRGIRRYKFNPYSSLRWMLPDLFLIWCIYLFIWLM